MILSQYQTSSRNRLELFKTLLQPHFLFNSLNNLYALSVNQSEQTPDAIAGLSQMLEKVVNFSRMEHISLSEELKLVEDYMGLERIWLGEYGFFVDFQVKGDTDDVFVPPLVIYTLVENAFKHGVRKCHENGWITIHLHVRKDRVLLKIRNSMDRQSANNQERASIPQSGLGLEAVRRLLDANYRKQYYLDAKPVGHVYAVDLIIGRIPSGVEGN